MPNVLITGANRGIGLELARQYAGAGWRVFACCRAPAKADALTKLGKSVEVLPLDVADEAQIAALAKRLDGQAIDVLINNAGIHGGEQEFGANDPEDWLRVFRVNSIAPLRLLQALVEQLARSDQRKVIAITSRMGSIAENLDGEDYVYRSSKAALNMAMASAAIDLKSRGIAVGLLHPGWVKTDMGGKDAPVSPEASATGVRQVIDALDLSRSGGFWDYQGRVLPW